MSSAPFLERAQRSQRDASARVSNLFERHGRMVYGVCRAMLRDSHEAEDATQQAFLSAYRALLGGADVRDGGAWMATIARNECRARIGASMRTPLPVGDEDLASVPAPGDEAERSLQFDALRRALAGLPERQREAVVLRYLYGLRYGEVATALGLSRPAAEALLFRARRALRHRLRTTVATTLTVPIAVQEALAQAIPRFVAPGSGAALAGAAGGGLLAKLTAAPIGAKVATAAVAMTTVGTVGSVESGPAERDRAVRAAIVAPASPDAPVHDRAGSGSAGRGGNHGEGVRLVEDGRSDDDGRNSRRGSSGPGDSARGDGEEDESSSGPGPASRDSSDDDSSGPGGGEDDTSGEDDPDDSADATNDSGPSGSSGSGSGDDAIDDSSGSGSDSSGSGSGSSGPASGGSEDGEDSDSGSGSDSGVGDDDPDDD